MAEYKATIRWARNAANFLDNRYSRAHRWHFDGDVDVPASSSPHVVKPPMSDEKAVDPEEAFVASLSSCHMLWFLHIAAQRKFVVDEYVDDAVGFLGKNEAGKMAITRVVLHPQVKFAGQAPDAKALAAMHERAHEECYIANSVKSEVLCEPR